MLSVQSSLLLNDETQNSIENKEKEYQKAFDSLTTNHGTFSQTFYPPLKGGDVGFPGQSLSDFHWDYENDEPHKTRRKLILNKYPQIKELMGFCSKTKYAVALSVFAQFALAYYLKDKMWTLQFWVLLKNFSYII